MAIFIFDGHEGFSLNKYLNENPNLRSLQNQAGRNIILSEKLTLKNLNEYCISKNVPRQVEILLQNLFTIECVCGYALCVPEICEAIYHKCP